MTAARISPALLLLVGLTAASSQTSEPEQMWVLAVDEPSPVLLSAWSPTGSCVAVATDETVHVIDRTGKPLWQWHARDASHFLYLRHSLAVAPGCDAIAVGGWSEYKYVWTADRNARLAYFQTTGTPEHVKFNLRGDTIAVTTGASHGYLLSPHLGLQWSGTLGDLPVKWPGQVVGAAERNAAEFSRQDVEDLFDVMSGFGVADSVSDDGQWRTVTSTPWRGSSGTGVLELFGPRAGGYKQRFDRAGAPAARWTKELGCPSATISRDGLFVIVEGDPAHAQYAQGVENPCAADSPIQILDRDGRTVLTWPADGSREEMAEAVFARTGVRLTVREMPAWDIPWTPEEVRRLPDVRRRLTPSPDGTELLVTRDHEVRMYRRRT